MIVDSHAHWYSDECLALIAQYCPDISLDRAPDGTTLVRWRGSLASNVPPYAADFDERLRLMDSLGIDLQVLSFGAVDIGWAGEHTPKVAWAVNNLLASVCRARPDRFRFLAVLPLADSRAMLTEAEHALSMGAVGLAVTTTTGGRPLDAPEYRAFWQFASERELTVAVHPCFPAGGPPADPGGFLLGGFPGETTLAATRLVLSGTLEAHPTAVVWSHVGGALPMLVARLDAGYRRFPTCPQPPSTYLARCYYDTVCAHGPALDCARATFGAGSLVLGTDEPHRLDSPEAILETLRSRPWPEAEIAGALGGTAERLFRLG